MMNDSDDTDTPDKLNALPEETNYAKIMPIAQSSGKGKSKTVDMVAMERILLPLCLREDIGKKYYGLWHEFWIVDAAYPPTDVIVCEYFAHAPSTIREADCKQHIRSFLSSLFAQAHLQAQQLFPPSKERLTYAYMAKAFHQFFAISLQRHRFYEAVVARARTTPSAGVWESLDMPESPQNWYPMAGK
jgi:hypothetical protein